MSKGTPIWTTVCLAMAAALIGALPSDARAQTQEQEDPGSRVMTVTTFDVPIQLRSTVMPYIVERVAPASQLNPKVLNFRVMLHNWGGNAAEVVMISEYADIADIESDCGQPCADYFDAHPTPEEGEKGYEEFQQAQGLYQEYYSNHRDEIYSTPMVVAKVEGKMMGRVGGPEAPAAAEEEGSDNRR